MSVKDSLKAKLATAATAITLITSPAAFSDDNVDADLAAHNKTEITQPHTPKREMHLDLPSDVPLKNARVGYADNFFGAPLTQTYFLTEMQGKIDPDSNAEVVLLVVKGGNKRANAQYEGAVRQMATNVSNAFAEPQAKVDFVLSVHPEEGVTNNGKTMSGGILVYINDHAVQGYFPEKFSKDSMLENIRDVQTFLIHSFENGLYKMDNEQLGEWLEQREKTAIGSSFAVSEGETGTGEGSGSSSGAAEQENTPMASLNL